MQEALDHFIQTHQYDDDLITALSDYYATNSSKEMNLDDIELNNVDFGILTKCVTDIQRLNMNGWKQITPAQWRNLAKDSSDIQSLSLSRCNVTDDEIEFITSTWPSLQSLDISHSSLITKRSIETISKNLTLLQSLDLSQSNHLITDNVLTQLTSLRSLTTLILSHNIKITNVSLEALSTACRNLIELNISRYSISEVLLV